MQFGRRAQKNATLHRRARACPSPASARASPPPLTVGRGPVPRLRSCTRNSTIAGDRPPRYGEKTVCVTVGRGPVPRQRSRYEKITSLRFVGPKTHIVMMDIAGDRPPRYGRRKSPPFTVGRGPVPRLRSCTRNSTIAGDRPPRYGEKS